MPVPGGFAPKREGAGAGDPKRPPAAGAPKAEVAGGAAPNRLGAGAGEPKPVLPKPPLGYHIKVKRRQP